MGNYRFKLSDMLPNAWFYKLNHTSISTTRKLHNSKHKLSNKKVQSKTKSSTLSSSVTAGAIPQSCQHRKSYHLNRDSISTSYLSETPIKSSSKRRGTKKSRASMKLSANSSASTEFFICHASHESIFTNPDHTSVVYSNCSPDASSSDVVPELERVKVDSPSNCIDWRTENTTATSKSQKNIKKSSNDFDLVSQLELKPIITKLHKGGNEIMPAVNFQGQSSLKVEEENLCSLKNCSNGEEKKCQDRNVRRNLAGVKLRANSRRIAPKKLTQVQGRKSMSLHSWLKSVAIVKESTDPDRDFKESMMEMIKEHNMSTEEEFEQLLACYFSLNSGTYHGLIIKVFEQICFEMAGNKVLVTKSN